MISLLTQSPPPRIYRPITPRILNCSVVEAYRTAIGDNGPVFLPAQAYVDDRGWSLMNQHQGVLRQPGEINYSVPYPGIIKAWHRHAKQTDYWICLSGHLKVGVHRDEDQVSWSLIFGERRPGVLIIPPGLWHGATVVGPDNAGLLYYVDHAYNPKVPDEERRPADSIPAFPWTVEHR